MRRMFPILIFPDFVQVTLRFALELEPRHISVAIKNLRIAVVKQPRFAAVSHVLANTLQFAFQRGLVALLGLGMALRAIEVLHAQQTAGRFHRCRCWQRCRSSR